MKHVELDNYYDNTKIMIDLDEKLSPKENAQKYSISFLVNSICSFNIFIEFLAF